MIMRTKSLSLFVRSANDEVRAHLCCDLNKQKGGVLVPFGWHRFGDMFSLLI